MRVNVLHKNWIATGRKYLWACALFALLPTLAHTQSPLADSLLQLLPLAPNDTNKVILLNDIAWEFKFEQPTQAREHLAQSIALSQQLGFLKGEGQAYNFLGVIATIHGEPDLALSNYQKAIEIRQQLGDRKGVASIHNNLGNIYLQQNNYKDAIAEFKQSLRVREELNDSLRVARVTHNLAKVFESMGDYSEALNYALDYLSLCERLKAEGEIANGQDLVGNIKYELERFDEALVHYQTALALREKGEDRRVLNLSRLNMGNILNDLAKENGEDNEDYELASQQFQQSEEYFQLALTYYQQSESQGEVGDIYNNLGVLFKNWGSYHLELEQQDSADWRFAEALSYFKQSLAIRSTSPENMRKVIEVYNGMGDVFRRQKRYEKALEYTKRYHDLADESGDKKFLQNAYKDFSRVYDKLEKYKKAFKWRKKYDELRWERLDEERTLLNARREAIYGDDQKQQAIEEQERALALQQAELKQAQLWRNSLMGGALGLVILALLLFNRNRIKQRANEELASKNSIIEAERKRSDELLLNILPEETAEELKRDGRTQAKRYESVTVLFTDFKSFTTVAAQMQPEELVAELDECFRAFDQIINKYGIEKIKTIGDSYMCAGGLPNPSADHPSRVVQAALEIVAFMEGLQARRAAEGRQSFQMRLGIHTGPVVAGVVGSKKFAYDIWGDTVNLASRMESSGAIGKVNISQATYEHVKSDFTCTYRGKIAIKNKGEADMYFVEAPIALTPERPNTKLWTI